MPRNIPPQPDYGDPGWSAERRVWEALQELPDEAVVFAQVRVLDRRRVTLEADFIVAWPGVGLSVIEVKGGRIWTQAGEWFSLDRRGVDHEIKNPIHQANQVAYALRQFAHSQGVHWPDWQPIAVLPDTVLPVGFGTAEAEPRQWLDSSAMPDLAARIGAACFDPQFGSAAEIVALLESHLPRPTEADLAATAQAQADLITRDQYQLLAALRTNDRIVITGGPGTGKTWLAMEHARQETMRGARVALLCFNRALARHLSQLASGWPTDQQPAFIGTLHQLALKWSGSVVPDQATSSWWEELPHYLLASAPERDRFDLVVVDEAQDFAADWWPAVTALLTHSEGPMVVFGDDEQSLYDRDPIPVQGVEVTLAENVRNTVEIASVLDVLDQSPVRCRGARGPNPTLIEVPIGRDAVAVADEVLAALLGEWNPGDIALLTTKYRHDQHEALLAELGPDGYTDRLLDRSEVAVSTVKSFKGLERPVVVVVVNGFAESAEQILRVAMSRPTHRLIVVAHADLLVAEVGADLVTALSTR